MKPADFADFFRRPAPEGRSRESGIRLDADGRFWHQEHLVEHPGMARAFASWLDRHPDDGRFILSNGYDWSYLEVDDVPFFVASLRRSGALLLITLSDGSEEPLALDALRWGEREAVYTLVKGGRFEARFTPSAQLGLEPFLVTGEDGEPQVAWEGRRFPISPRKNPFHEGA